MKSTENNRHQFETQATEARGGPIEVICDAFEGDLKHGRRPVIEQLLASWEEPERSKLLFELLSLEIHYGYVHGGQQSQQDYLARFPDHREVVHEAFVATVAAAQTDEKLVMNSTFRPRAVIGEGGLGIVYVADDQQLQRDTAVKFIQESLRTNPRNQELFRLEAEITSRLEHPGVVPVYGMGQTADGRLFYVMRLIRGERLDEAIAKFYQGETANSPSSLGRQVQFHELLNHFAAICRTIAYAHYRGVVHRDIKPGNVMLGKYGEALVIDWGLAAHVGRKGVFKDSSEKTLMPGAGTGSSQNSGGGTPPYMSPEQAAGKEDLGPASDIYSLGATMYTVITGQVPFKGIVSDILRKVTVGEFPRPTQVKKGISHALEAICLKAMSLDPKQRYSTALEIAEDVDRFLADAPVSAYSEPLSRRLARWARRNRITAQTALASLVLFALTGGVVAVLERQQAQRQGQLRADADSARKTEQALRTRSLQVSAEFAARMMANQIDIRWRILEKEAGDSQLHTLLQAINAQPDSDALRIPLQKLLDDVVQRDYAGVSCRSWSILAHDGVQVARRPSHDKDGKPIESLGRNFAFRDYFHGKGLDYRPDERQDLKPLAGPHNSTVIRSVVGGDLTVLLSVPIRTHGGDSLGVLTMSIELGQFADLQINLPEGQRVLLVESRRYYMLEENLDSDGERGEGLVLHHDNLSKAMTKNSLPHLDDQIVRYMRDAKSRWTNINGKDKLLDNLLPGGYFDPVENDRAARWLAAFAPVLVSGRPDAQQNTGWFVIVQQRQ